MTGSVAIVDYGVGNLRSVLRAFEACGAEARLVETPGDVSGADRLVIPGVGAFGSCLSALRDHGLEEAVVDFLTRSGRPALGICVGFQMLFDVSEEFGEHAGLGIMRGRVAPIPRAGAGGERRKVPHIGWSPLVLPETRDNWRGSPLEHTKPGELVYFVHSFAAVPEDPADVLAETVYAGARICAAVQRENVVGVQFHPEKSGPAGLRILEAFLSV